LKSSNTKGLEDDEPFSSIEDIAVTVADMLCVWKKKCKDPSVSVFRVMFSNYEVVCAPNQSENSFVAKDDSLLVCLRRVTQ